MSGWRLQTKDGATVAHEDAQTFDELAVGQWLHVEWSAGRSYFMQVGPLALWIEVSREGLARIVHSEDRSCSECHEMGGAGGHKKSCATGAEAEARARRLANTQGEAT